MKEYNDKELIIIACSNCNANCSHYYISYGGNRTLQELLLLVQKSKDRYELNIDGAEGFN